MHIGMVLITDDGFPPDVRVDKEAVSLVVRGHKVTVLARRTSENQAEHLWEEAPLMLVMSP